MINIFTDVLILFIYIITMFYFKVPNISNNNYVTHKLYLFVGTFAFFFISNMIKNLMGKKQIDIHDVLKDTLIMALVCVIGYSIFIDLRTWDKTRNIMSGETGIITRGNKIFKNETSGIQMSAALVIVLLVTLIEVVEVMFTVRK